MSDPGSSDRPSPSQPQVSRDRTPPAAGAPHLTRAFLFADLRDFTGYVEARGNQAAAALLERYQELVRAAIADTGGAEIRTEGDSFYVVFDAVSDAVRCGLAIVEGASASAGDPDPIRVGVGVHAGETVATGGGFVGSAVNIAARLGAEAKAGELVVSDTVRALTRTSVDVDFVPLGTRRLKGVAEPVACYRVVSRSEAAGHPRARPSVRGRGSWLLAAGLGIAAVAAVAVGAAVLVDGGGAAAPTPSPSAAAIASPSVTASAPPGATPAGSSQPTAPAASPTLGPFPNEVEARILAALPPTLAKTCRRGGTSDDARLAGFKGSVWAGGPEGTPASFGGVTCRPTTGAMRTYVMAPKTAYYNAEGLAPADEWLALLAAKYRIPSGWSCGIQDRAFGPWTSTTGTGNFACMNPYDGRPWIYFTFGDGRYLAFATRDDADYDALYAWFDQLKTFLP